MKAIRDIKKRISQKEEEAQRLRHELAKTEAYIEAAQEMLKLIEKQTSTENGKTSIRPGSMVDKARLALKQAGKPLHIEELLRRIGREPNKKNRASLTGSLGTYVREKTVFTRPQPATFGLVEFDFETGDDLPEDFGR